MGISTPEDVGEADNSIEQGTNQQRCLLLDSISVAGLLEMAHHRLFADPEDARAFPRGLAARRPDEAVALPVGEARPRSGWHGAGEPDTPRALEGGDARKLRPLQRIRRQGAAGTDRETARTRGFADDIGGHGEAVGT